MDCPSEAVLQDFVDGRLSAAAVVKLSLHLDACPDCCAVIGAAQSVRDGGEDADRIGRYLLRRAIGKGGMGVVYEAYDPELDRIVALKLLRAELGAPALQARLVGEAQAMAKLSHRNVVSVYDIGRAGEQVYIVMDLIDGTSLRHWISAAPRSIGAALDVFLQAGEGLAAAHSAGLVHRDFKPENVFVAREGRVVVGDFGLALAGADAATRSSIASEGSPAYMAPEQRDGTGLDARSDQFSFCLTLKEAIDELVATSKGSTRAPRWLASIVDRGLEKDPARRYASMTALLDAIARARRGQRTRRIGVGLLAVGLVLGTATFWAGSTRQRTRQLCRGGAAAWEQLWSPTIVQRLQVAFEQTRSPLAVGSWRSVRSALEAYSAAWMTAHQATCEATRVRGEQSEAVLDKKMSCLAERRQLFGAVVTLLDHVDAAMLERVPSVLALLQPIVVCEELNETSPSAAPPPAGKLMEVDAARQAIARATAALSAGRYQEGLRFANEAQAAAATSHYLPVQAEAALWLGTAHGRLGNTKDAETALERAASSASAGHAEAIAVRAWIQLMHYIGFDARRYDDGLRYNEYAEAALRAMPGAAELDVERMSWLSAILVDKQSYPEALAASRRQLALVEARFGKDHRLHAAAEDGIAGILSVQGKALDAVGLQTRACETLERTLGAPHPQVALCLNNLAALYANLGRHEIAIELKQRALTMFGELPGHPSHVAMTHRNLARSFIELGRLEEAEAQLDAATPAKPGADQLSLLRLRGEIYRRRGRLAEALAEHTAAVTASRAMDQSKQLDPLVALAETQLTLRQGRAAAATAGQAVRLAEELFGKISFRLAEPLRLEAEAMLLDGDRAQTVVIAERALALLDGAQLDPLQVARTQLCLARALPTDAASNERAHELLASARLIATIEARDQALVATIDRALHR